ncbi:hypothetical protein A0J61_09689 [Choanephora cucurbitarum]|uniref:Uncharacterized protein n=1 Tax=Choanephora cucurbitarum TaxID=101091 RepID=A0A1C7MZL3_9FUNG|nr:hypothetical protein A0J61_09689 [Choanephora cucurbitarum]
MESIISTFVGVFFPHTIEIVDVEQKVYFLLYEPRSARYSVKAIADREMVEKSLLDYDEAWTLDCIKTKKEPIIVSATGPMKQMPSVTGFLGRAMEEKFHITPLALQVIPCIPLVTEKLKDMVHPEVGPTVLEEGVKEGYFFVNLSLNQNFDDGAEFFGIDTNNRDQNEHDIDDNHNEENQHADEEEIVDPLEETGPSQQRDTEADDEFLFLNQLNDDEDARRFSDNSSIGSGDNNDAANRMRFVSDFDSFDHQEINVSNDTQRHLNETSKLASSNVYDDGEDFGTQIISAMYRSDSSERTIRQARPTTSATLANRNKPVHCYQPIIRPSYFEAESSTAFQFTEDNFEEERIDYSDNNINYERNICNSGLQKCTGEGKQRAEVSIVAASQNLKWPLHLAIQAPDLPLL